MRCSELSFSDHAISQMFKRDIETSDIHFLIEHGEMINEYPYDKPYPSYLLMAYVNQRPLHLVLAKDERSEKCIVITAYQPDQLIWEADFRTKRK